MLFISVSNFTHILFCSIHLHYALEIDFPLKGAESTGPFKMRAISRYTIPMRNNRLYLCLPNTHDETAVWQFRDACTKTDGHHIAGSAALGLAQNFQSWLLEATKRRTVKRSDGIVPSTVYLAKRISDDEIVGIIDVRHSLNDYLQKFGGHLGYSVRPQYRRQGYATEMLGLALDKCRSLGLSKVLVTCDKTNIASASVIKANGGVLENELEESGIIKQRYWIQL